jgi:hypothetical protein
MYQSAGDLNLNFSCKRSALLPGVDSEALGAVGADQQLFEQEERKRTLVEKLRHPTQAADLTPSPPSPVQEPLGSALEAGELVGARCL